jgi:glyoxylase-like metal-dependent hydrolase (beta-lactamase superfamily II)
MYDQKFLFSGDHLAWSEERQHLIAFRDACWYSWAELIKSMQRLASYSFEWVLPGHGRRYHADTATMRQAMQQCLDWMATA